MTRRSLIKSLMGAVAAVAIAPEIAFGVRLKMPRCGAPTLDAFTNDGKRHLFHAERMWVATDYMGVAEWCSLEPPSHV